MKALLVLLLAGAIGYVGYKYAYPPIAESFGLVKKVEKKQEIAVVVPEPEPEPMPEPEPEPVPEMKPEPEPKPEPKPAMPVVPEPPKPEEPKPDPNLFVPPEFDPIETVVGNWMKIPKSAFPRPVILKKDLEIEIKIGNSKAKSKVPAGGQVIALAQDGANITVAPTETSPARSQVGIDETDLKAVLTDIYENWKVARVEFLRRAHEYKLSAAANAKNTMANASAAQKNDQPVKGEDGYPVLLASMKSGQVTEVTPDNVLEWGDAQLETIDGETYWTVIVKYETETMFGKFETEAQARILNGKVMKWVYTGSGEEVP